MLDVVLAREPHHLSQLLTDDVLRIISKPQRCVVPGLIKTGFKSSAADAINAASTEAEVPLALCCEALDYCEPAAPTLTRIRYV